MNKRYYLYKRFHGETGWYSIEWFTTKKECVKWMHYYKGTGGCQFKIEVVYEPN